MDLETYRMLQDPNFSLIVIWGMVCITVVTVTTIAYFFSMMNNIFNHYNNKKLSKTIEQLKDDIIEELN